MSTTESSSEVQKMELENLKRVVFEIFVAGFQDGYMRSIDVVTAFENWWKDHVEALFDGK